MLSSNLSDGEDWIFERVLEAGDPGIVDDTHSIIFDYAGKVIVKAQRQRLIALAGFGLEIMFCPLLYFAGLWLYPWVVAVHLIAYPFYAGEHNDFRWGK